MKLTFLGTGTSTGVPAIGCNCPVCRSTDPMDKRLRASVLLSFDGGHNVLIDCGPDFREQILRCGSPALDSVLITHTHYDHLGGVDDLRPYSHHAADSHFPLYLRHDVARDLRARVPYCFAEHPYPGVPTFTLNIIKEGERFFPTADRKVEFEALAIKHGKLDILGFRCGPLAYITDCSHLPEQTFKALEGVDTLVLNALRIAPHPTHFSLAESLEAVRRIEPRQAYFTHMSHDMGFHKEVDASLPENVHLAYDGLTIEI